MMATRLLAALLVPFCALAQLQLYTRDSAGAEIPVASQIDVGTAPGGDILDTRCRIRNTTDTSVTLRRLSVAGVGFSLEGHPSVPYVVAPGTNVDFRVRFRPPAFGSYSASLFINDTVIIVLGRSPASASLLLEDNGQWTVLSAGASVNFGRVERGSNSERRFRIENPAMTPVTVNALAVIGSSFSGIGGPQTPLVLNPKEFAEFGVRFEPERAGLHSGTLQLDQRSFQLDGFAVDPPFPEPQITFSSQTPQSGQQGRVSVRLSGPAPVAGTGKLEIEFRPVPGTGNDPAIQFLSSGNRSMTLSVPAGGEAVQLGGQAEAVFQTGTTAGEMVFTVRVGATKKQAALTIVPAAITFDAARMARTLIGVEVELTGFDNTRSASYVVFTFFDKNGRVLGAGPIRADASEGFRKYFENAPLGGVFSLRAAFPIAGDPSLIAGLEVEIANSAGSAKTRRINF